VGIREDFAAQPQEVRANFEGMYGASAPYFWAAQSNRIQVPPEAQGFYNLPPADQATWYGVHGENAATVWAQANGQPGAKPPGQGGYGAKGQSSNPAAGTPYGDQKPAYPGSNVVPGSGKDASGNPSFGTTRTPYMGATQPGGYTNRLGEMNPFSERQGSFNGAGWFDPEGNRHFIGRDDEGGPLGWGKQEMATQRNAATGKMEEAGIRLGRQDSGWDPAANGGKGGPRNTTGAYYGAQPFSFISGRGGLNGLPAAGEGSWVGLNKSYGSGGQGDPTDDAGAYDESKGYAGAGGQQNWNKWVHSGRGGGVNPMAGLLARGAMGGGGGASTMQQPMTGASAPPAMGMGMGAAAPAAQPVDPAMAQQQMAPAPQPMQDPQPMALPYYQTGYATGGGGGGSGGSNTPGAPAGVGGGPTPTAQLFVGPGVNLEGDWAVLGNLLLRSDTESSLNTSGIPQEYAPLIARAIQLGVVRVTNRGWDFLKKVFNMTPASIGGVAPNLAALVGVQPDGSGAGTADYGGQVDANTIGYGTQINGGGVTNGNVTAPPAAGAGANPNGVSGTYAEGEMTPFGPIKGGLPNGFDLEWNKLLDKIKSDAVNQAIEQAKLTGKFNGLDTLEAQKLAAEIKDAAEKNAINKINADANMKQAIADEAYKKAVAEYNLLKLKQDAEVATGYVGDKATVEMQRLLAEQQQAAYARAANPAMAFENEYARGATGWNTGNTAGMEGVPGMTAPGQSVAQFGASGAWQAQPGIPQPGAQTPPVQPYPATPAPTVAQQYAQSASSQGVQTGPTAQAAPAPSAQTQTGASNNIFAQQSEAQPSVQPTAAATQTAQTADTSTGTATGSASTPPSSGVSIRTPAAVEAFKAGTGVSSSGNYGATTGSVQDANVAPISSSQVRLQNLKQTRKLSPVARAVVGSFAGAGGVDKDTFKMYSERAAPGAKVTTGGYSLK